MISRGVGTWSRPCSPRSTIPWRSPGRRSSVRCWSSSAFDDDDDAVRIANDSNYGLGGAVLSGSLERSLAVAARVRTGVLSINGGMVYGADLPFGGFKDSGIGRQNGIAGFDQYLETKSLAWPAG